jgi:DNA-binding CsgD family transcriptional regulator
VVLDSDLDLVASTPDADRLLAQLDRASTARPLPVAVYAVAAALEGIDRATVPAGVLPSATVPTTAGYWLNIHASRLLGPPGEDRIAVVVEPARPRATTSLLLSAHGLTARETEVARLVLRGESTRAISGSMHISAHTVQDHLKSIFDKTGVRSRGELVGQIFLDHYATRWEAPATATPGLLVRSISPDERRCP